MFRYPGNTQVTNVGCCQNTATVDYKKGPLQNLSLLALLILWFVNNISKTNVHLICFIDPKRSCIRAFGVYIPQGEMSTPHIKRDKIIQNYPNCSFLKHSCHILSPGRPGDWIIGIHFNDSHIARCMLHHVVLGGIEWTHGTSRSRLVFSPFCWR